MSLPFYVSPEQVMQDKAEYARKGIGRGKSSITLEFEGGIVLLAENPATLSKIGEIYDLPRDAFGHMTLRRTRFGYPMYDIEQDEVRRSLELEAAGAGIRGLHLLGRTGQFRYILLEESHRLAVEAARRILAPAGSERFVAAGG